MPNYKYTALNNNGSKKIGILSASSEREARKFIKELKLTKKQGNYFNDKAISNFIRSQNIDY
jgi:type II secretory pathway component PulF